MKLDRCDWSNSYILDSYHSRILFIKKETTCKNEERWLSLLKAKVILQRKTLLPSTGFEVNMLGCVLCLYINSIPRAAWCAT